MKLRKAVTIFCIFIMAALGTALLVFSEKLDAFSEKENRMLHGFPETNAENIFSGRFSADFEVFLIDKMILRNNLIAAIQSIKDGLSLAGLDDTMRVVDVGEINQMEGDIIPEDNPVNTADVAPPPEHSASPEPSGMPDSYVKPSPTPESTPIPDFGKYRYVYITRQNGDKDINAKYSTSDIIKFGQALSPVAESLPKGGHFIYITSSVSSRMRKPIALVNDGENISFTDETDEVLKSFMPDNTIVLSGYEILGEKIKQKKYVYFFTDMHWSVEGAYNVYRQAFEKMGKTPLEWESYDVTYEKPFLGTYYRDNPSKTYRDNPDTLAIIDFMQADYYTRYITMEETAQLPIINSNADANDRFTVYFGKTKNFGSMGYVKTTSNTGENAIVIQDSFGLCFTNLLIPHYDNIYILDMRYVDRNVISESLSELIKKYTINDFFVVTGDLNSYGSSYNDAVIKMAK